MFRQDEHLLSLNVPADERSYEDNENNGMYQKWVKMWYYGSKNGRKQAYKMGMVHIQQQVYELLTDHKEGWKSEIFHKRYSEILGKYDYIVGDWGYGQLRLKGFYEAGSPRVTRETNIHHLQEYLTEYCNFGCSYFILRKMKKERI
ncbi:YutD family protein [Mechercharimyces sp. CAU 1602]|uniref:YutD family protein n=1 Tax=Mechercharimyces sp. CAU 1602 TaxID=2973933 RepID=UPI002161711F|nr:YutD family protein [Mechercharimyces sp. CAU 1602]MCS1351789.1 YutD family protein [Mechercharimyces sp. CAU 1602]